jgi:dihydrofolate reductase
MRSLSAVEFLSLDGVMQSPGSPDEDASGGFRHGGWGTSFFDPVMGEAAASGMATTDAYIFGRITYDGMAAHWPNTPPDDPIGSHLNAAAKYVVSRGRPTLTWSGTTLLEGDPAETVAALKTQDGGNICVLGSGELVRTLLAAGLVDELMVTIHPIVIGSGKQLFGAAESPFGMELVGPPTTTTKGSVILRYHPA